MATRSKDFQRLIVEPTLAKLAHYDPRMNSPASLILVMGTAAQESDLGFFWVQNTPQEVGKGFYSMEENTLNFLMSYLDRSGKETLKEIILRMVSMENQSNLLQELIDNPKFATAMARLRYWPIKESLPHKNDLLALGAYWDKYYNGNPTYGTAEEWVDSYNTFVQGD